MHPVTNFGTSGLEELERIDATEHLKSLRRWISFVGLRIRPPGGDRSVWRYGKDYWVVKIDANGTMLWEKLMVQAWTTFAMMPWSFLMVDIYWVEHLPHFLTWAEKSQNSMGGNDFWVVKIE